MRIFVTGATGFIGTHGVGQLLAAGHQVLGLARSQASAASLIDAGADVQEGSLEDLESLKEGARASDAVIHLGFNHDFSKFAENCEIDRRAIETMGAVLAGTGRPLIVTAGTAGLGKPGVPATENDGISPDFPSPRVSEQTALGLLAKGVSAAVVRLPQVHDTARQGLVSYAIALARQKGVSAYLGDGSNRWSAAHVSDVARLYRLALERHQAGAIYHAVGEEGVRMRDVAEVIGRGLQVPVVSLPAEEAAAHFGWLAMFADHDLAASSLLTRERLGWKPTGPGLIEDLERMDYAAES